MSDHLFLSIPGASSISCKIDPVVVFIILDQYHRRSSGQYRVIGTLLGSKQDNLIEIKNCFAVPHSEDGESISLEMDYHRKMLDLHTKANQGETIVGWYSTGTEIDENSVLVDNFYRESQANPIHLTVDVELSNSRLEIQPYISTDLGVDANQKIGKQFQPIAYELSTSDIEPGSLLALMRSKESETLSAPLETDIDVLGSSLANLLKMLNTVTEYVNDVVAGKREGDKKIGRIISSCLNSLPHVNSEEFEKLFSNSLQDKLAVVYLANLTRTQLALAEKLQSSF